MDLSRFKPQPVLSDAQQRAADRVQGNPDSVAQRQREELLRIAPNMQFGATGSWGDPLSSAQAGVDVGLQANPYTVTGGYAAGGGGAVDKDAGLRNKLKGKIGSRGNEIDAAYNELFGLLDELVRSRDSELETQYGEQFAKAASQYAEALPMIDQSYAALGSYDSTQRGDSRGKAKAGYDETTKAIGKDKEKDKAALGQYKSEQRAKFEADKSSAKRAVESSNSTTDVDALRGLSNDLDANLSQTGVTKATLQPDASARKAVTDLTQNNGRFEAATNALDSIIKSSMSGDVKQAAVKAITDNAGLSDDEKKRVDQMYGNVYAEQAAL